MNKLRVPLFPSLPLCALLLILGGCSIVPAPQADPTRFYVLPAEAGSPPPVPAGEPETAASLSVGLLRVDLPAYLNTSSIVVRHGAAEVSFADLARWGEPLEAGVRRVLEQTLAASPAIGRVLSYPFPGGVPRDVDVTVRINRCEGASPARGGGGGTARFSATYQIMSADGSGEVKARGTFEAPPAPWDGTDYTALVRALGEAATGLAQAIASDLTKLE